MLIGGPRGGHSASSFTIDSQLGTTMNPVLRLAPRHRRPQRQLSELAERSWRSRLAVHVVRVVSKLEP